MAVDDWLYRLTTATPLWLIAVVLVAGSYLACEFGYRAYARMRARRGDSDTSDEGLIISAALGLLALLIGFTFTVTLQRFQDRDALIVAEANAISINWRRARIIGNPAGDALAAQVAAYLDARLAQLDAGIDGLAHRPGAVAADASRRTLWPLTQDAIAPLRDTPLAVAVMAATEQTLNTATQLDAAFEAHLPPRVVAMLVVYTLTTAFILGYVLGASNSRHRTVTAILFVLIAMAIVLVIDLDRPFDGSAELDRAPLLELQAEMHAYRQ